MARRKTRSRKDVRLTSEGWVYLVILGFIATGAVLRNVNLLILMSGLMFAPLIINWRVGVLRLKTLSAKRALPHRVYAGQFFSVQWICVNQARLAGWNIQVIDSIGRVEPFLQAEQSNDSESPPKTDDAESKAAVRVEATGRWTSLTNRFRRRVPPGTSVVRVNFVQVAASSSEVASYRAFFARRGKYIVGPAQLMTSFPFGLVATRIRIPEQQVFFVAPKLGVLTPKWDKRVQSVVVGSDAIKRKRGLEDDEFYALRPWRSGDSKKQIHWRTSAKYGQPIVRQHDQPDNRDFAMLLDLHVEQPLTESSACERVETILSFAATVILHLGSAVQGRIALGICGQTTELCRSRNHREIIDQAMRKLAQVQPASHPDFTPTLIEMAQAVSGSTPLYIISTRCEPDHAAFLKTLKQNDEFDSTEEAQHFSRLRNVWPLVRWIEVGSEEFQRLFAAENKGMSTDAKVIEELSRKWASKNAAG